MKKLAELLISEATEYEFKGKLETRKPKSWLKTVSAFSNGLGGSIYFGVNKDGVPEGVEDIQKDSEIISQLVNAKIDPMVYINLSPYVLEGDIKILRLEVKPGMMTPYYYSSDGNKIAYVRLGEESVQAPSHILNELILKGQHSTFDAMISKYEKSDFSFSVLEATYRQKVRNKLEVNDYISFGLTDLSGNLTNAGVLMSDQCPLMQSRIFCTRWDGNNKGSIFSDALDDKEYEGNIISLLDNAKQFIINNSKKRWKKTADGRIDMPDYEEEAIHEALVNALVHRSYLNPGTEIHVDMYDDRLDISSPGGMFSGKKIQELDLWQIPSERRNPVLADIFNRMRFMERRGSGIKKILKIYDGKKQPRFQSTETDFIITFYNLNYEATYAKPPIKQLIQEEKQLFGELKQSFSHIKGTQKTRDHIEHLYTYYQNDGIFGRKEIMDLLHISSNPAGELIRKMKDANLITPVKGYGKGKYKFHKI